MTRKDYELLSTTIKNEIKFCRTLYVKQGESKYIDMASGISHLAYVLGNELALGNKAFDTELFLKNCGIK